MRQLGDFLFEEFCRIYLQVAGDLFSPLWCRAAFAHPAD